MIVWEGCFFGFIENSGFYKCCLCFLWFMVWDSGNGYWCVKGGKIDGEKVMMWKRKL